MKSSNVVANSLRNNNEQYTSYVRQIIFTSINTLSLWTTPETSVSVTEPLTTNMNLVRQTNTKIRLIGVQGSKILEKLSQKMIKKKGITHLSTSEAGGPD